MTRVAAGKAAAGKKKVAPKKRAAKKVAPALVREKCETCETPVTLTRRQFDAMCKSGEEILCEECEYPGEDEEIGWTDGGSPIYAEDL